MRIVLQRVSSASVMVEKKIVGQISRGYVVFLGIGHGDTEQITEELVDKILKLRIFPDENGKSNLSIEDVGGGICVVSQFTLYADCQKGHRPEFINAAASDEASALYEYFIRYLKNRFPIVAQGVFGAKMQVELVNDGPYTIIMER